MLKKLRKSLIWYVFVAPTFFLYALFVAYPTFETFRLSLFHEVATRQEFVGALHYMRLLSNQVFLAALLNTAFLGIIFLLIIIPLSLVMASLLNNLRYGQIFSRQFTSCLKLHPPSRSLWSLALSSSQIGVWSTVCFASWVWIHCPSGWQNRAMC